MSDTTVTLTAGTLRHGQEATLRNLPLNLWLMSPVDLG
jgi:hypothetical protein